MIYDSKKGTKSPENLVNNFLYYDYNDHFWQKRT